MKIRVKLAKDPTNYAVNSPNKRIGTLLGAKAGDVVWYYKTDGDNEKGGVSINPKKVGIYNYKEMLKATVKDALGILGYDTERIFNNNVGITRGDGEINNDDY